MASRRRRREPPAPPPPTIIEPRSPGSYALQLDSASYVQIPNNTTLEASANIWGAFNCRGDFLNALSGNGNYIGIHSVANSGFSVFKAGLLWAGPSGVFGVITGPITALSSHSGTNVGSFNNTLYYDCAWKVVPSGGPDAFFAVYADGDLFGTVLAYWDTPGVISALSTASGVGAVRLGSTTDAGLSGLQEVFGWAKAGVDSSLATQDIPLEEGSGSSVSPSGSITGTYTWISFGASGIADDDNGMPSYLLTPRQSPWIATVFS